MLRMRLALESNEWEKRLMADFRLSSTTGQDRDYSSLGS